MDNDGGGDGMAKRRIARAAGLALIAWIVPGIATASTVDPRLVSLAEKVLVASGNDAQVAAINRGLSEQRSLTTALQAALPAAKPEWQPAISAAVQAEVEVEAKEFFDENTQIYATHFTEAELNDMLAFYASPGGKALVAQTPSIIREKMAFGRRLGGEAMERMVAAVCAKEPCSSH